MENLIEYMCSCSETSAWGYFIGFVFSHESLLNPPTEIKTKREVCNMELWEGKIFPSDMEK